VPVAAGPHRLELSFEPSSLLTWCYRIAIAAWIYFITYGAFLFFRRPSPSLTA
jgi:hypothetical protein